MAETNGSTVNAVIEHSDGTEHAVPITTDQIQYDETGTKPIGIVTPLAEIGDEFVRIEPIPAPTNPVSPK